jgi:uncharacterized protein (DUF1919 family)
MKWKSVYDDVPYKNQLCLCRKPYSYKEDFWFDYDYSICVYIEYERLILETNATCDLYDFTEWVSMDEVEEAMESET